MPFTLVGDGQLTPRTMFHTLNRKNLKLIEEKGVPVKFQLPTPKLTKFFGARARSILGCLTCRESRYVITTLFCNVAFAMFHACTNVVQKEVR